MPAPPPPPVLVWYAPQYRHVPESLPLTVPGAQGSGSGGPLAATRGGGGALPEGLCSAECCAVILFPPGAPGSLDVPPRQGPWPQPRATPPPPHEKNLSSREK